MFFSNGSKKHHLKWITWKRWIKKDAPLEKEHQRQILLTPIKNLPNEFWLLNDLL